MRFNFDNSYTKLPEELFSEVLPEKAKAPHLIFFNEDLASEIGLTGFSNKEDVAEMLSGYALPQGAHPIAQAYSGHQFGHFTKLGDGRAILLGEQINPQGKRFDIQLKGSGQTPYSRQGDGKATLSSMLREYIFSEALHALGIPTTRSLAIVATGDAVYREKVSEGAVLTRVAQSHIRIGTFQHAHQHLDKSTQRALLQYTIDRHYPHLNNEDNKALGLLKVVMEKQISLIVNWMRVGFIHGVMNTDNILISGETIDYGPCAFLNSYQPQKSFSSIDHNGRYAFEKQASIAQWNVTRFAESLLPQIDPNPELAIELAQEVLSTFQAQFYHQYLYMMGQKIGFMNIRSKNYALITDLLGWMEDRKADYTNTFIHLMDHGMIVDEVYNDPAFFKWKQTWLETLEKEKSTHYEQKELMKRQNPIYIPRNYLVESALKKATENSNNDALNQLISKVTQPYNNTFDIAFTKAPSDSFDEYYQTFCGT